MRAYKSLSMHMHAHAALTLFYKRLFFFQSFFLILPFPKTNFLYTIYHLFGSNKKIPFSCLIWVHFVLGKNHQMTQIISRNHTAWGPIRRVGLLVNTAYPMQSVKARMRCLSSVAFLKSPKIFKIL